MSPSTSSPSTALSYYTAVAESPNNAEYDTTNISSPGEPLASEYRDARELPYELKSRVKIFLEEKMYLAGIQMLDSLLSPGGSRSRPTAPSTWIPPPAQLAMLNTLMVHPSYTSRAAEREDAQISTRASKYLRDLLTVAGPIHAGFRAAFDFHSSQRGSRRGQGVPSFVMEDDEGLCDENSLNARLAGDGSLWARGQEFWRVVGWAFNCSTLHPHRWKYWKPWLEYMLDVLEADFDERMRLDQEAHERAGGKGECGDQHVRNSLIMVYLCNCDNRGGLRQIFKALVADGSSSSSLLFLEVFDKEAKKIASTPTKRKRAVLDLENDKFGDYFDDDSLPSSQVSETVSPLKARVSNRTMPPKAKSSPPVTQGMRESVPLRLRLFYRLAWVALRLPSRFVELCDIYVTFADALRELPAPFFALFVSTSSSPLPTDSLSTLLRHILPHYLPSSAPDPDEVEEAGDDDEVDLEYGISTTMLQYCFLPYAANSVSLEANAKMSLVLESLLRLVWVGGTITWTAELQTAVEKGIAARSAKTKPRKNARAKPDGDDQVARKIMDDSSQRLLTIMSVIKSS